MDLGLAEPLPRTAAALRVLHLLVEGGAAAALARSAGAEAAAELDAAVGSSLEAAART